MSDIGQLLSSHRVQRGSRVRYVRHCITTGLAALDAFVPGGGFQLGGVTELLGEGGRYQVALAAMAANSEKMRCAYLSAAGLLNPLIIKSAGGNLAHCYFLIQPRPREMFWSAQQVLASGLVRLLVIDASHWRKGYPLVDPVSYRRLLGLSGKQQAVVLLLLQEHPRLAQMGRPCLLRLQLQAGTVTVLKCAGTAPGASLDLTAHSSQLTAHSSESPS